MFFYKNIKSGNGREITHNNEIGGNTQFTRILYYVGSIAHRLKYISNSYMSEIIRSDYQIKRLFN